ncbi:MAG: hypothetical protein LBO07_00765, partial [Coriobacteriales bacterium]|nr:hypothetical protein [Coriobacteriales bacterium]
MPGAAPQSGASTGDDAAGAEGDDAEGDNVGGVGGAAEEDDAGGVDTDDADAGDPADAAGAEEDDADDPADAGPPAASVAPFGGGFSLLAADYIIDLSTTTANGTGYTVTGTSPSQILTFTSAAYGNSYTIQQTSTSLFKQIIVAAPGIPGDTLDITINGISVTSSVAGEPTFALQSDAGVALTLAGASSLTQAVTNLSNDNNAALNVPAGTSLSISGTGSLTATGGFRSAGIGGGFDQAGGTITIRDATVTATGDNSAAGIGGGRNGAGGDITVYSGTVIAEGGDSGAGIGGGAGGGGGTITIEGGNVTAEGGADAAGIGGGSNGTGHGGTITIEGGTVTATGGESGAGIGGGGDGGAGGDIDISGTADITATGGDYAAGIGGGYEGAGGDITISGAANVTATGGENAAGIGGGHNGSGGTVNITGGTVTATGGESGAGIGGGYGQAGDTIAITGGIIIATGGGGDGAGIGGGYGGAGGDITISGTADVTATGGYDDGAGIGGGEGGAGGAVTIEGGSVKATGGEFGAGIGGGFNGDGGTIAISGGTVNAASGEFGGAGIGGGASSGGAGDGGNITITGGKVVATGVTSDDEDSGGGAGIGGGVNSSGGTIAISGGSINATGAKNAAGIGGGDGSSSYGRDGGTIAISGTANVTATGGYEAAGIGGGKGGGPAIVSIARTATVKAYSENSARPAIHATAAGNQGGGYYVNAAFTSAPSASAPTTLAVHAGGPGAAAPASTLTLPAGYRCFAYTTGATSTQDDAVTALDPAPPATSPSAVVRDSDNSLKIPSVNTNAVLAVRLKDVVVINLSTTTSGGPGYTVSGSNPNRVLTFGTDPSTYNGESASDNVYRIIQSSTSIYKQIVVQTGVETSITIVSINVTNSGEADPTFALQGTASVALTLEGTSSLRQTYAVTTGITAALGVPASASLTIGGTGSLTAQGGNGSAGIGSDYNSAGGTITINSGTVTAKGGSGGAGIGGGANTAGGAITINGGAVTAAGGENGAGIGGGSYGAGGSVTINGGTVTAKGGAHGAGIGGGGNNGAGGTITINGGAVTATGGSNGAGIGGGSYSGGGSVTINGTADVTATGDSGGAGIGGGLSGGTAVVNIASTATVKAYAYRNSGNYRPAIHASAANAGSGNYVNAYFPSDSPPSTSQATTLKVYGNSGQDVTDTLTLPTNYRCFAYTTGATARTDAIVAYNAAGTTKLSEVIRVNNLSPEIPSGKASGPLAVKLLANTTLTVSKQVAGTRADTTKAFEFTLWLYDYDGATPLAGTQFSYTGGVVAGSGATAPSGGTFTLDAEGKATFSLTHGQSITVTGIPENRRVRVAETVPATSSYAASFKDSAQSAVVVQGADTGVRALSATPRTFAFTNTKGVMVIDLSKTVTGGPGYTVSGTTSDGGGGQVSDPDRVLTFGTYNGESASDNTYRIIQSRGAGTSIYKRIIVQTDVDTSITIVGIDVTSKATGESTFALVGTASVALTLEGTSSLRQTNGSNSNNAALNVPASASLTISGSGSLTAQGGRYGAGIGGGGDDGNVNSNSGSVAISSGTVTATGGYGAAGIGGGYHGANSSVTIEGGTVTATGGTQGAGIGGGNGGKNGIGSVAINISGGTVTAKGGERAAGIGGGYYDGAAGSIAISGTAKVTATGGSGNGGAGIGGGYNNPANAGSVTVSGAAEVTATGTGGGAGIGGGYNGNGGTVTVSGGTVTATGSSGGAGIGGGGYCAGGTVSITGGSVTATGGAAGGAGIGAGGGGTGTRADAAVVTIGAGATVKAYAYRSSGDNRPAIHASAANGGDGNYVNASFPDTAPPPTNAVTTLRVYAEGTVTEQPSDTLALPAGYRCFAYTTGATERDDAIVAYNAADTTKLGEVVRVSDLSPEIPSGKAAAPLAVKLLGNTTLTLSKQVAGENADTTKAFEFTLWLYDYDGTTPLPQGTQFSYTGGVLAGSGATAPSGGTLTLDADGKAAFSLAHGQSVTVAALPENRHVRIVEAGAATSSYAASFKDSAETAAEQGADTGVRALSATPRSFDFTNTKGIVVIDLSKTVTGGPGYTVNGTTAPGGGGQIASPDRVLTFGTYNGESASDNVYRIIQSDGAGTSIYKQIVVQTGVETSITIEDIDVTSKAQNEPTFALQGTASVALVLEGESSLTQAVASSDLQNNAALSVPAGASLSISGTGKLTAQGGYHSAGIGSGENSAGGIITIEGATVIATGGSGGAGIGGGYGSNCGTVTVYSGTVTATGNNGGAGIGNGNSGVGGAVTIAAGTVTATGGQAGAGIGGSSLTITITGGAVTARGGNWGSGIGSNSGGLVNTIAIGGGTVTATGGGNGAGIGGAQGRAGGT